jgi:hypothetical protein
VPGTTQEEGVIVILSAQPLLVVGHLIGKTDLVAGRTKLFRFHKGLQEGLFVKVGFRFDQRVVHPLQHSICAVSEGVVDGFINGVGSVTDRAVDVRDAVASRAGNASLTRWVLLHVEVRVVESSAEERHQIMATRAPSGGLHIAIPLQPHRARLFHAEKIGRIVKRTESVRAVKPTRIGIGMALLAVLIHHQRLGRNEIAARGSGGGG